MKYEFVGEGETFKCNHPDQVSYLYLPLAAIPLYGRSADNIRDHRHVTALLNRVRTTDNGIELIPALSFDERGHCANDTCYGVYGAEDNGSKPVGFYTDMQEFTGEGGNLYWPRAAVTETVPLTSAGIKDEGYEVIGGIQFKTLILHPKEDKEYIIIMSYNQEGVSYLHLANAEAAFNNLEIFWQEKSAVKCSTGNAEFDHFMDWVGIQPYLRRVYGCSFMPHHDYGRGGRGWRDRWQDCLALILADADAVRCCERL